MRHDEPDPTDDAEVATLADVTSVAAATIAMRKGPVETPSARASRRQRHHIHTPAQCTSTMVPAATGQQRKQI